MKLLKFIFFSVLVSSLALTSCKKDDNSPKDANAAGDNATADNAFAGIWKQISTVTDSSGNLRALPGCATATITPYDLTTWPKTVTIDFGTTNCLGNDGNNRRGIVTAVFSGRYLDSGTVITVTLTNFYHNDYKIQGTQTITNLGNNTAGHLVYNVVVNNATITNPTNAKSSSWTTNQNREFFAGYNTPINVLDDVYIITGNASGVSEDGEAYTIVVNTGLRINIGCRWIVSGTFTLTLQKYPNYPIVFDYGNGTCDALATATLNGKTYNIVMK